MSRAILTLSIITVGLALLALLSLSAPVPATWRVALAQPAATVGTVAALVLLALLWQRGRMT